MLGLLGHKDSKHKKKSVGHFEALVLSSLRKGFPLEVDFGASWGMFRPILGHSGASRQLAEL